jgi:hypothetical protein
VAAIKAKEALVAPVLGLAKVFESGVGLSVLCWCVWQESSFSSREHVLK